MNNKELADIFTLIGDLMQIKGEVVYKFAAYRKAAESLAEQSRSAKDIYEEGGVKALKEIPGVGQAIAEKIEELLTTGKLEFLEKLTEEIPASLAPLLEVPDMGPKKVKLFYDELGITNLEDLKAAAEGGKLAELPGMGAKSEEKILAGIESLSRRTGRSNLEAAWPLAQEQLALLRAVKGVTQAEVAGSLRRMRDSIGDIDILVAAADSAPVMEAFTGQPGVARIVGKGAIKSSVEFNNGMRAQVWVHPPAKFGTALQYATGSKDHNVRLRELALSQGYSLSEQAITVVETEEELDFSDEKNVYAHLGLDWVPPELREDRGEVKAAQHGKLPDLITINDIQMELHCHSTWSDGKQTIEAMAQAAVDRGMKLLAITDHSYSLGIANGLTVERLHEQRKEIEKVRKKFDGQLTILQGTEMEIRADGSLDFDDDTLAWLDFVIASLHTGNRQPREQVTMRMLSALNNPHVDMIAHPTNRLIPDREGADLDIDAVLKAANETDTILEINANPRRLDLNDITAKRAAEMGIKITIDTDAHDIDHLDLLHFGVANARRAWLTKKNVVNCWEPEDFVKWLIARG
jgi:DNA polymerase (family 10)